MGSVAGPMWFAWLATSQIKQRFQLAEDYGFKAAVSKAYEGYRKSALDLDDAFMEKLFASALNRLDEYPLRLFPADMHSTPFMELVSNPSLKKLIDKSPELVAKIVQMISTAQKEEPAKQSSAATKTSIPTDPIKPAQDVSHFPSLIHLA